VLQQASSVVLWLLEALVWVSCSFVRAGPSPAELHYTSHFFIILETRVYFLPLRVRYAAAHMRRGFLARDRNTHASSMPV